MILAKKIKSIMLASVLVGSLTSCTEEEVSDTITIIAAAAIISTIDNNNDHDYRYDDHHYHDHHHGHRDSCYRYDRYCDCCRSRHGYSLQTTNTIFDLLQNENTSSTVEKMAQHYNISTSAAEKLFQALEKAKTKDFSGVDDIGIARTDLNALYDSKSLSRASYVNIGASLGLSFEEAHVFVAQVQENIKTVRQSLGK